MITIKKGLDIPLSGTPEQVIHDITTINEVAITGSSFNDLKPSFKVAENEQVKKGQVIFVDKQHPSVKFVSPIAGTISKINRGEKRKFLSVVITADNTNEEVQFKSYSLIDLDSKSEQVKEQLLDTGLWSLLRTRPFNNIADPNIIPNSLFVNAMDTNPGAANPNVIINENKEAFEFGLAVLNAVFKDITKFVVTNKDLSLSNTHNFKQEHFSGPHPAGLVGTHIHFLAPVGSKTTAYHLNYQSVIAIGNTFKTGKLDSSKVIALSGPQVKNPCLFRITNGANVIELTNGKLKDGNNRIISGSVLDGVNSLADVTQFEGNTNKSYSYVGHYDLQLSVLLEGTEKEFIGWVLPQPKKFSLSRLNFFGRKNLPLTTTTNGSDRAMVPIGLYERVFPFDMYPTLLLRDLLSNDTDSAQAMGALELAEEDVALCSFVCPGKYDYSIYLRKALNKIEKEG